MIKQRQKVIRLADESELGWKVVDEYMQSEIASDEEDQKKIHRAQARARGKAKTDREGRGRRYTPYRSRSLHPAETMSYQAYQSRQQPVQQQQRQQQQQRLGVCFLCGQAGHWKVDCPTNKRNYKLSKSSFSQSTFIAHSEDNCSLSTEKSSRCNVTEVGLSNSFNPEIYWKNQSIYQNLIVRERYLSFHPIIG